MILYIGDSIKTVPKHFEPKIKDGSAKKLFF